MTNPAGHDSGLVLPFNGIEPKIDESCFNAAGSAVIGDVEIGARSSVWYNCVLRGDANFIRVGSGTNIQDGTIVHVTTRLHGTTIGNDVLIGHGALIHGCTLEDGCFVGFRATVMDGAVVESGAQVAAGALVTPGKRVPSGEIWAGSPAKFMRELSDEDKKYLAIAAPRYANLAQAHKHNIPLDQVGDI